MERVDYRRQVRSDVWHWHPSCPKWPTKAFECSDTAPTSGHRCKECGGFE